MRHIFILHCNLHLAITVIYPWYIYNAVLSWIFKVNTKKIEKWLIFITKKCQMLQRKILSLSNLSLFESETIFSRKIISERKAKLLLWIYAWRLSGHLWFNNRRNLPVVGLNWNPWLHINLQKLPRRLNLENRCSW